MVDSAIMICYYLEIFTWFYCISFLGVKGLYLFCRAFKGLSPSLYIVHTSLLGVFGVWSLWDSYRFDNVLGSFRIQLQILCNFVLYCNKITNFSEEKKNKTGRQGRKCLISKFVSKCDFLISKQYFISVYFHLFYTIHPWMSSNRY